MCRRPVTALGTFGNFLLNTIVLVKRLEFGLTVEGVFCGLNYSKFIYSFLYWKVQEKELTHQGVLFNF